MKSHSNRRSPMVSKDSRWPTSLMSMSAPGPFSLMAAISCCMISTMWWWKTLFGQLQTVRPSPLIANSSVTQAAPASCLSGQPVCSLIHNGVSLSQAAHACLGMRKEAHNPTSDELEAEFQPGGRRTRAAPDRAVKATGRAFQQRIIE